MTVKAEVETFLDGKSAGPLAAIALALAGRLDDSDEKSPAAVAKELRETLDLIAKRAPAEEVDPVDDLAAKRTQRRAAASGS